MQRSGRKRRAAPEDIYRNCKQWGTCPPDVLNKIENNTLADRILKWISPFLYLGNLGISSGRGTSAGAGRGFIPLERPFPGYGSDLVPIPPAESEVTVGVGPVPVVPADPPIGVDTGGESIELVPLIPQRPTPEVPAIVEGPVDTGVNVTPVVPDLIELEMDPINIEPSRIEPPVIVSTSMFDNPTFEVGITASTTSGESSAVNHVFVGERVGGTQIGGGEEIPLRVFRDDTVDSGEFNVEDTGFTTSTPEGRPQVRGDRGYLYNRRLVQQVEVNEPEFLERPRDLITFENPVFNDQDLTMIFDNELNEITRTPPRAAPHRDFTDIRYIGKKLFSRVRGGRVRVSRLGKKGTLRTRSGVQIGTHVHYYQDISSILPAEEVELLPLGEVTGTEEVVTGEGETPFVEINLNDASDGVLAEPAEDQNMLVELGDDFFDSQTNSLPVPDLRSRSFYPDDIVGFGGISIRVDYPRVTGQDIVPSIIPIDTPWVPYHAFHDTVADFIFEPCLYGKRKRKRLCL